MKREPNTEYILSLSYGKDSMACLGAIEQQGWPLDRIVTVEVWATDTIPADLPPMVEFKERADAIIKERWGIEVEHVTAMKSQRERERERETYESMFYRVQTRGKYIGNIKGFPPTRGAWCKHLKYGSKVDLSGYLLSSNPNKRRQEDIRISDEADAVVYGVTQTRSDREDAPQYAGGVALNAYNILVLLLMNPKDLLALIR